jgi:hypothetical protein
MGCPALGIWVGFFKQPALPGKAPQKKSIYYIHTLQFAIDDSRFAIFNFLQFFTKLLNKHLICGFYDN